MKDEERDAQKALGTLPPVIEIVLEGRTSGEIEQLSNAFGDIEDGNTPIYFRRTDEDEAILASKRPITDEDLDDYYKRFDHYYDDEEAKEKCLSDPNGRKNG